ncbi:hypothetical protein ETD86_34750 [Nonomuraea turkmeniaca]|uniref:Uncharacterized protein n=1 Tax=Nonomuraea turkmeniaca TaxID=103838 RepID=A0A5S4F623_9ACTN|nr:hypothetical protein [Nonomuraea turkmeniaca]TMR11731.1 hypothetical protein ETD86_34750 [Nonomuraea turkmeniaca]
MRDLARRYLARLLGVPSPADLLRRVEEAEAIIRAQNTLQIAMYNSDYETSWPREAAELEAAYCERYAVDLDGDDV